MSWRAPRFAVDIAVAFQFLTRLPVPPVAFAPDGLARAVKFFPVVGLAIGSGAALVEKAARAAPRPPRHRACQCCSTWC